MSSPKGHQQDSYRQKTIILDEKFLSAELVRHCGQLAGGSSRGHHGEHRRVRFSGDQPWILFH